MNHHPKKVFESSTAIVLDDFLPQSVFEKVHNYVLTADYERINKTGTGIWHVHDGFPLKSEPCYYRPGRQGKSGTDKVYPSGTALDPFIDHMVALLPQVEYFVGRPQETWKQFSVVPSIFPPGTSLSTHAHYFVTEKQGGDELTGAFVYFLNPEWRVHWGGLLLLIDEDGNKMINEYRRAAATGDGSQKTDANWLVLKDPRVGDEVQRLLMEHGLGQVVFPKNNRLVFIANEVYHQITRVNEQAGDNGRMSLTGFFTR